MESIVHTWGRVKISHTTYKEYKVNANRVAVYFVSCSLPSFYVQKAYSK